MPPMHHWATEDPGPEWEASCQVGAQHGHEPHLPEGLGGRELPASWFLSPSWSQGPGQTLDPDS